MQLTDYLHRRMKSACKEERRDILEVLNDIKTARAVTRKIRRQISDNETTKKLNSETDNLPSISRIKRSHSFATSRLGKMFPSVKQKLDLDFSFGRQTNILSLQTSSILNSIFTVYQCLILHL
jgi:hypothetical protein